MSIAIISNIKEQKNSIVLEFAHIARGYMCINTFEKFYYEKKDWISAIKVSSIFLLLFNTCRKL